MSVKVEKQEKSKVTLEFTMAKDEFNKELDKAFLKNAKYFKVPGFRSGKVPRAVVEKMYGESVLFETVIEDTVDEAYRAAVEENNLEVVSRPELDVKQIGKDKDFIYTITFFVKPDATVSEYKGLKVKKTDLTVTDEDIENALKDAQDKNARTITIEDRPLQDGDISTIDFEGFVDDVAFEGGKGENYELTIGSGTFIPGFEDQLVGMNIGEEREISVKFPEEYHADNLAGKDAKFKVKLISIKAKDLPAIDDEFVKDISEFETLDEYKKDLKEKLAKKKEDEAKASKESQVIEKIIENTEVEIPEAMVNDEVAKMVEEFSANLSYQGLDFDTYCTYANTTKEEFSENLKPQAINDIKLKLALEYIANKEEVKVEDTEINEKIEELAKQYGSENAESLKENANVRKYMNDKLQQDKTLEVVVNSAIEE